jgi:hypothetical protein
MHELSQWQAERPDVVSSGFVAQRYPHGAGLSVQAVVKAKRPNASTNVFPVGFQQRYGMAAAFELVGSTQTGKSGTDDDHTERLAAVRDRSESARQRSCGRRPTQRYQTSKKFAARERQ